ncbi:MAG: menaquinone biosynthesis protein [Fibrobacter sp.]|uniref:menaquinone biosynthetic enzyme MqnA/MqnD family protein n=1 Tax=Fibrobacter sp. TaxID=35828 RepID=UPI002A91CE70|nr:menaquinone biosynthesis protein [Fibrobacter sp.]MDY6264618.1 menaquinone biosynthesis protein [Fibrobacter sp.]
MALRVGRIPFLVCAPFFHDFLGRESRLADVEFVDGPPSAHCAGLKDGLIHLSPASSITFAQKPGAFVLAPDICTSCSFEVRSVKLYAKRPIEDLDGRTVRLTGQSMTSVNLLKILMRERFGVEPVYGVGAYEPSDDACLLIGDQALEENERHRFAFDYDLGSLWQDWQGVPFVFGAWIISKSALQPELRDTLKMYLQATRESIESFRTNPSRALDRWLERYPVQLPRSVVENYYSALDYRFTEERKRSLSLFFEHAARLGLIREAPPLEFLLF